MSEFFTFAELGFRHITDPEGADHILFLLALAAIYRFRDWRELLWVVTAFTVGHSITLALAVSGVLSLSMPLIEFLIPVTIVITALENLLRKDRAAVSGVQWHRPVLAGIFGLVHGAGFANYLRSLFVERIAVPLLGFNVGLEVGQIAVLVLAALALAALDGLLARIRLPAVLPPPFRLRVVAVSLIVAVIATGWAVERSPW
jgi:hypothetical protein